MTSPKDGGDDSETGCYEALPYAGQIWQRLSMGEPSRQVARDLGLSFFSVGRIATMCRFLGKPPSQARLCVCVLNHPDLSDEEIAEMFGRNVTWVADVRSRREAIRYAEPFPEYCEWCDEGVSPKDPTQLEIAERAKEIRSMWRDGLEGRYPEGMFTPFRRAARETTA